MSNTTLIMDVEPKFRARMTPQEYEQRLSMIRKKVKPLPWRRPKRKTRRDPGDYYETMIAETLRVIRKRQTDYVFREEQIVELLKYEPDLVVEYKPKVGMWLVALAA